MNNVSVRLVFDRKHIATKNHQASVQMEVLFQRRRKYVGTGVKLYSDQWGKDNKIRNHPQSVVLNQRLNDLVAKIYDFAYQLSVKNVQFTFEKLEEYLNNHSADPEDSFLHFMLDRLEARPIKDSSKVKQYGIWKALKEFGKIRRFSDITYNNIMLYDEFAKKRCSKQSSVYTYHKVLKIYVREAMAKGLIDSNPYQTIKLNRGKEGDRKYLTKEELKKIEDREVSDKSLNNIKDVFLFCCYTGLSYADLASFNFKEAVMINGMYRIKDHRIKTGEPYNITIMDKAMKILQKHNFSLPVVSNQKYNAYLKVLGAYCDVKQRLTSHVARHTFATTIALANGVRIEVVSKMLGHSNIRTTQLYAKICQPEVDCEFERLNVLV